MADNTDDWFGNLEVSTNGGAYIAADNFVFSLEPYV